MNKLILSVALLCLLLTGCSGYNYDGSALSEHELKEMSIFEKACERINVPDNVTFCENSHSGKPLSFSPIAFECCKKCFIEDDEGNVKHEEFCAIDYERND